MIDAKMTGGSMQRRERREVLNLTDDDIDRIADAAIDRAVLRFKSSMMGRFFERLLWLALLILATQFHIPFDKLGAGP